MGDFGKAGLVAVAILAVIFMPFLLIWGINDLSKQVGLTFELPYNFWTWLSCVAISAVIKGSNN